MNLLVNHQLGLNLMIDTGDTSPLSLNPADWQAVFSTTGIRTKVVTVADAIKQIARSKVGVVPRLTLAGLDYTNLHAMFIRRPDQPSRIGLGFFHRHQVIFDFARNRLFLQPGQYFSVPDVEDMSGLHLLRIGSNATIYSVDDDSPAASGDVRQDDIIERINNRAATDLSMKDIRQLLRTGDGDLVTLQLRRNDQPLTITLVLKKNI